MVKDSYDAEAGELAQDEVIYHYCSVDAFLNILERKTLWLSSIRRSNDANEGDLLFAELNEIVRADNRSDGNFILQNLINESAPIRRMDAFGLCFSRKRDLLSQWRGYADDGRGFVIGFNKKQLQKILSKQFSLAGGTARDVYVDSISYLSKDQVVAQAEEIIRLIKNADENFQKILNEIFRDLFRTKSWGFSEEEEVRAYVMYYADAYPIALDLKFRNSAGKIIPYVEADFKDNPQELIKEIILGPKNVNRCDDIKLFLLKNGYQQLVVNSCVEYSEITYR